jgi:hypothetical protein
MMRNNGVFVLLFSCTLLLVMGALDRQSTGYSSVAGAAFVAQSSEIEPSAAQILARAAANVDPANVQWLTCKIWQKQIAEELSFEAEGRLVRGPNQCGRFEMKVRTGDNATEVVTVSDGIGLAHSCRHVGKPAQVATLKFVTAEDRPLPPEHIEAILHSYGCTGPYQLLKDLEARLENWQLATGTWKDRAILRLTGSVKNDPAESSEMNPKTCHVFLDEQTLWPLRVEWWAPRDGGDYLFLAMEFRDAVVNLPLSHDDCVREFTFLPEE